MYKSLPHILTQSVLSIIHTQTTLQTSTYTKQNCPIVKTIRAAAVSKGFYNNPILILLWINLEKFSAISKFYNSKIRQSFSCSMFAFQGAEAMPKKGLK